MSNPQEQFAELTRRTQENFKNLWQQWSERSTELMKGVSGRSPSTGSAPGNLEEVLDAVFDFAANMIEQQRAFAKQMLKAASKGQEISASAGEGTSGSPLSSLPSTPDVPAATPETSGMLPDANKGR
jgi:methyl-accepting chemotaxis protein